MRARWAERAYALLVDTFPRHFRYEYGDAMKLLFRELLDDPEVSTADLMRRVLADARYAAGGILLGAVLGSLVVLIWYVVRSDGVPYDPNAAYLQIMLLFLVSGLAGRLRSGAASGGLMVGFVAGVVSALFVVPGESWIFHTGDSDPASFVFRWGFAAMFVMALVLVGATMNGLPSLRHRAGRGLRAFVNAWRTPGQSDPG